MSSTRFKLVFFVPKDHTRRVLDHLFRVCPTDLGNIGNYEKVAFIGRGTGQFLPKAGANPTIGTVGQLELVEEDRVEILVTSDSGERGGLRNAIKELKNVHPYEEVVYEVYKLEDF